jgi:PHD/YefM family antitoxin component YafN of YafNO toxin-antitoxin module
MMITSVAGGFILGVVDSEPRNDADRLAAAAEEVEAGRGPVAVARPGHPPVVLVTAEKWQRLQELEAAESTAWWRRDTAERAASGEEPGAAGRLMREGRRSAETRLGPVGC